MPTPTAPIERFLYSIPDAGVALGGLSVRSIKYLISKGDLQARHNGGRVMVTRESIRRYALTDHPESIRPSTRVMLKQAA
jgi:hypothetical protein